MHAGLAIIVLIITINPWLTASERTRTESPHNQWLTWIEAGKGPSTIVLAPGSINTPFKAWETQLADLYVELSPEAASTTTVAIGTWYGLKIKSHTNIVAQQKVIYAETPAGVQPLLIMDRWAGDSFDLAAEPQLMLVDGQNILSFERRIRGTGHFWYRYYFAWDTETGLPSRIDFVPLEQAVQAALPKTMATWKGGQMNFQGGHYVTNVYRPGDNNCCPSGGLVRATWKLQGAKLTALSVSYDPHNKFP